VAKLVSPASNAKIVTARMIEASFLRVEIETCNEASVIGKTLTADGKSSEVYLVRARGTKPSLWTPLLAVECAYRRPEEAL